MIMLSMNNELEQKCYKGLALASHLLTLIDSYEWFPLNIIVM